MVLGQYRTYRSSPMESVARTQGPHIVSGQCTLECYAQIHCASVQPAPVALTLEAFPVGGTTRKAQRNTCKLTGHNGARLEQFCVSLNY